MENILHLLRLPHRGEVFRRLREETARPEELEIATKG